MPPPPLRLLAFGMACAASAPSLAALLRAGFALMGLVLPGPSKAPAPYPSPEHQERGGLVGAEVPEWRLVTAEVREPGASAPLARAPGRGPARGWRLEARAASPPEHLALDAGVPIRRVARANLPALAADLAAVDAAVVACFPWKIPTALLDLPRLGWLNVHPALLPRNRGSEPIFWTLRRGERETGVTVHRLDPGVDTGPIVAQRAVPLEPGVRAPDLEQALMALGGELLVEALAGLDAGTRLPVPQDETAATRAPLPTPADWLLPTLLPAAWAWTFARGVAPLGGPLAVAVGATGDVIPVADALAWHPTDRPDAPFAWTDTGTLRIRFNPGWVEFAEGCR